MSAKRLDCKDSACYSGDDCLNVKSCVGIGGRLVRKWGSHRVGHAKGATVMIVPESARHLFVVSLG